MMTSISVEISSDIQIFIPLKVSFFLEGIQESGLIIKMFFSEMKATYKYYSK